MIDLVNWGLLLVGFGVTARSTAEARKLDPTGITVFRKADIGEYLREASPLLFVTPYGHAPNAVQEDTLFRT
jgi:hypothetical protein